MGEDFLSAHLSFRNLTSHDYETIELPVSACQRISKHTYLWLTALGADQVDPRLVLASAVLRHGCQGKELDERCA